MQLRITSMLIFRLRIIRYAVFIGQRHHYDVDKMVALNNKEALENNSIKNTERKGV
jgi:hypothetical protein